MTIIQPRGESIVTREVIAFLQTSPRAFLRLYWISHILEEVL
jgi:hypothetical protein